MNSRLGPNSLIVEFVDMEKALGDFARLTHDRDQALWTMGDIVDRVVRAVTMSEGIRRAFARDGISMAGFARQVGLSPSRLKALRLAAATFAPKERQADLSWEHHYVVAKHLAGESVSTRRRWLRDAQKHQWSARQLGRRLAARRQRAGSESAEERVERLRRRLAQAEEELALRRQGRTRGQKK